MSPGAPYQSASRAVKLKYHADWIAHGIMDSIVDSFFPFLEDIEKEVAAIEALVFSTNVYGFADDQSSFAETSSSVTIVSDSADRGKKSFEQLNPLTLKHEDTIHSVGAKTHFSLPSRPRRTWRIIRSYFDAFKKMMRFHTRTKDTQSNATISMVHRMAKTRRLVTSLTRVLAAKSEVVTQLKKRLLRTGLAGLGEGLGDDQDVFMYMGDVQGLWSVIIS